MAELKTKLNDASVEDFLQSIIPEQKRKDAFEILELMKAVTNETPMMWGTSIIGFGTYHFVYASGREGDWMRIGFSPRKQNISLYIMCGSPSEPEIISRIGKCKRSKGCFYINKLADVDKNVLKELIQASWDKMNERFPIEE